MIDTKKLSGNPFSVGMAVFNDFDGVYFTTQSLLTHHAPYVGQIIVVDNNPNDRTRRYVQSIHGTYVPMPEPKGTAPPRNEVFRHARHDRVVVLDSHVLLEPGAFKSLNEHVTDDDLYHGPLIYDWGDICATHMRNEWRGEMWGIWSQAWQHESGGPILEETGVNGRLEEVMTGIESDVRPEWPNVRGSLRAMGYRQPVSKFEIPAHGMGLWACRRDSWLGFNPEFRHFGGEEFYIHVKYRQAGRKVWCLPDVRWRHRFSDLTTHKIEYPLSLEGKVRNYCIGLKELGLPLDPIYKEFGGRLTKEKIMACGCGAKQLPSDSKPSQPASHYPEDWIVGKSLDLSGMTMADAGARDAEPVDTLVVGKNAAILGKWASSAPRFVVYGNDPVVIPLLLKKPEYTLVKRTGSWLLLSRRPEDKGEMVGAGTTVLNGLMAAGRAAVSAVKDKKLPLVTTATQETRMAQCRVCPHRADDRCTLCGCFVSKKTWVASEKCPDGRWHATTGSSSQSTVSQGSGTS